MNVAYRLGDLEFEWNTDKAEINLAKHRISFEEAAEIFLDPLCALGDDNEHDEARSYAIGYSYGQRLLLMLREE